MFTFAGGTASAPSSITRIRIGRETVGGRPLNVEILAELTEGLGGPRPSRPLVLTGDGALLLKSTSFSRYCWALGVLFVRRRGRSLFLDFGSITSVAVMFPAHIKRPLLRGGILAAVLVLGSLGTGCASHAHVAARPTISADLSPAAERVAPVDAWTLAEAYAAGRTGTKVLVGSGDSMLPLYPSRTVLVVQPMNMADLRSGMTVVFIGDSGRPVAHTLVRNTARGWIAMGIGNTVPDRRTVQFRNYIGTVVKAYLPTQDVPAMAATDTTTARMAAVATMSSEPVYFERR
jgi:hypothetical protein